MQYNASPIAPSVGRVMTSKTQGEAFECDSRIKEILGIKTIEAMSTASNGSVTSKSSKQKFSAQLKELLVSAKKVLGSEKDIDSIDRILDERRELEERLISKTAEAVAKDKHIASIQSATKKEIEQLQRAKNVLIKEFQERFKAWDTGTTKQNELETEAEDHERKLGDMTKRADFAKGKIAQLQKEVLKYQNDLKDTRDKLKSAKKDLGSAGRELTGALLQLENLQGEWKTLGLQDIDHSELSAKFDTLVETCHKLVKKFYFTSLPAGVTCDDLSDKLHRSGFTKVAPKSIPMSSSLPSQYLRMAAAEKIIAQKLCKNIFQQYYLPEFVADRQAMDSVLERLFRKSPREEAIFRLRLLSAYKSEEGHHVMSIVESTIQEVVAILSPLLFQNSQDAFQSEFGKLLREAVKLWSPVQRSPVRACVDNDPEYGWGTFEEYDARMDLTPDSMKHIPVPSNPIESLFPRVSIGEDVICQGYALWSSQTMVVAAGLEYSQSKSPILAHGRPGSSRGAVARRDSDKRRLSINSSSAVGDGRADSPTSQRHQSFSDHITSRNKAPSGKST